MYKTKDAAVDGITWTGERIAQAKALRWYRLQWNKCAPEEQSRLEWLVYGLRGQGVPEREVCHAVEDALELRRPWRMSDAKLGRRLGALYAYRLQMKMQRR